MVKQYGTIAPHSPPSNVKNLSQLPIPAPVQKFLNNKERVYLLRSNVPARDKRKKINMAHSSRKSLWTLNILLKKITTRGKRWTNPLNCEYMHPEPRGGEFVEGEMRYASAIAQETIAQETIAQETIVQETIAHRRSVSF